MHYPPNMDKDGEKSLFADTIKKRIERTPDDWYISDDGKVLYALLAGAYLWSMSAPEGTNFHTMNSTKIILLIQDELRNSLE